MADARSGTGRCFMSRTATSAKRRVFPEERIASSYTYISLLKTKTKNIKVYISLEQLKINNMQQTSVIDFLQS